MAEDSLLCPYCGSERGMCGDLDSDESGVRQQYLCLQCGKWYYGIFEMILIRVEQERLTNGEE